jgi:hypothetical protein
MKSIYQIQALLNGESNEVSVAHEEILKLQSGDANVIVTGQDHLDYFLIGGINNKMVFIGSRPSMGKTFHCETMINNLLDENINKNQDISLLRLNLEMQTKSLLLRDLKKSLGKKMRDIIANPYTEEEMEIVNKVLNKHKDPRVTNFSSLLGPVEFEYLVKEYCKKVSLEKPNTQKIVLIDHIHIYQTKKEIDEILSICNQLKMSDPNLSFIIYFQFNRSIEDLWRGSKDTKANPKNFLPHSGHIYNTDSLMQFADLVMGMTIPQVVDLDEFVSVYKDRNVHLEEHFISSSSKDTSTTLLKGRNRIYYNYIKIRLVDDFEDPRLYCSVLNADYEKTVDKMYEEKSKESVIPNVMKPPVFDATSSMPTFNTTAISNAAGSGFDSPPF